MLIAIVLILGGSILAEASSSLGKYTVNHKMIGVFGLGFLNAFFGFCLFAGTVLIRPEAWHFSFDSLPTLSLRLALEFLQLWCSLKAMALCTRGTFGLVRSITIPLVLIADVLLGYTIGFWPMIGMGIVFLTLVGLALLGDLERKGLKYLLLSAVNASFTITLYKYNVSHFNSIAAEQLIVMLFLTVAFYIALRMRGGRALPIIRRPLLAAEASALSGAGMMEAFSFAFIPASVATTAIRSLSVFWSILFGKAYFKELHFAAKIIGCAVIVCGLVLLMR